MVVGFSGSRVIPDIGVETHARRLVSYWLECWCNENDVEVIHGGADGFDQMANSEAYMAGCRINTIRPDYKRYADRPKYAPIARNEEIVKQCDVLVAYWNGHPKSRGTLWALGFALRDGKEYRLIVHDDQGRFPCRAYITGEADDLIRKAMAAAEPPITIPVVEEG